MITIAASRKTAFACSARVVHIDAVCLCFFCIVIIVYPTLLSSSTCRCPARGHPINLRPSAKNSPHIQSRRERYSRIGKIRGEFQRQKGRIILITKEGQGHQLLRGSKAAGAAMPEHGRDHDANISLISSAVYIDILLVLVQMPIFSASLIRPSRKSGWAMLMSASARSHVDLPFSMAAPYSVTI